MATLASRSRRIRTGVPTSILLGLLTFAFSTGQAEAATPSIFTSVRQPISVAALTSRILATRFCADRVLTINAAGTITKFADLPSTGNSCLARDVVVSPGKGGFPKNFVFAVQKQTIYRIPPTGGTATPFVTIDTLENSESSMTFDTVGSFGFDLIVTDRLGEIWRVASDGVAALVADVGHQAEGPTVAPTSFAPFGGQILATDDFADSIFAVAPNGTETPVATYGSPESVVFVPKVRCEFDSTGGAFFMASQTNDAIYKLPKADFTGLTQRDALVLTKTGKLGLLTSTNGVISIEDFEPNPFAQELESGTFFPCA